MNINLNLFKYFYTVAKYESYTKAAEELMISQPSISYSIKILEEQLGNKLFQRTTKGIEITKAGKELYEKITPIIQSLDSICNEDESINGTIKIGVRTYYSQKILPNKIRLINLIYPELKIEVEIRQTDGLNKLINNDEVDIIFDEYDLSNENLKSQKIKLENTKCCFFTSKNRDINKITKETIENEKILNVEENRFSKEVLDLYPEIQRDNSYSTPIMVEEVKMRHRIGFSCIMLIDNYLKAGDIKILESDYNFPEITTGMYATYNKRRYNKKIEKIINLFMEYNDEETIETLNNKINN